MSVTSMATQLSVRLNDELEEELEEYRQSHEFPPQKSEVVRAALEEYLEREREADKF
jgi:Arc/MetJ-type ribon-helix-helix transcriptional regulator